MYAQKSAREDSDHPIEQAGAAEVGTDPLCPRSPLGYGTQKREPVTVTPSHGDGRWQGIVVVSLVQPELAGPRPPQVGHPQGVLGTRQSPPVKTPFLGDPDPRCPAQYP